MTHKLENQTNQETTITVDAPSIEQAWAQVRAQSGWIAAQATTEQDRFLALATHVVKTSKQDIARTEAEEKARKRLRESGEQNANGALPEAEEDPQWRKDRKAKLTQA